MRTMRTSPARAPPTAMGISMLFSSSWHSSTAGTSRHPPCSSGHVDLTRRPLPPLYLCPAGEDYTGGGEEGGNSNQLSLEKLLQGWAILHNHGNYGQCTVQGAWALLDTELTRHTAFSYPNFTGGRATLFLKTTCSNVMCVQLRRAAHFESKITQEGELALKLSDWEREPSPSTLPCNRETI